MAIKSFDEVYGNNNSPRIKSFDEVYGNSNQNDSKGKSAIQKVGSTAKYLGGKALTGISGTLANLVTKPLTTSANDLSKGNKKSTVNNALNVLESAFENPVTAFTKNLTGSLIKNIKDKDSNLLQKAVNTTLDVTSPDTLPNKSMQLMGSILPGNASDKILKTKEVVSSPVNKLRDSVNELGENQNKAVQVAGSVIENVGQMLPSIAGTVITGDPNAGLGLMGISASEGGTNEALQKGADLEKAVKIGNLKGQIEIGTEMLAGGLNIFGKGSLDDLVEKNIIEKAKSKVAKKLLEKGYEIGGEILEETISDLAGTVIDKGTVDSNASYSIDDWNETALVTALSTVALNILTNGAAGALNMVNNNTNINTNENIEENVNNNIENITNISDLQTNANSSLYSYEQTSNTKINNFRESVVNNQLNNSNETQNFVNTVEKVINDKNYNIVLDNTITNSNGESVNAQVTTNQNGEVEIRLNPNSERAGEFLLIHEISHAIKSQEMIDLVNDFAARDEGFADAIKTIESHYGKDLTSEEVFADVCGQLFGNQEFINSLQMENTVQSRSLIKQIYEQIKYLLNKLTKEGRYRNFVQDLEAKWRVAYQTQDNNLNGETNYAIGNTDTATLTTNQERRIGLAKHYQENGYTQDEIWRKTGVTNSNGNRYDFYINDLVFKPGVEIKSNSEYVLKDIMNGEMFDSYPMFKDLKMYYYDIVKLAREEGITNKQYLDNIAHVSGATLSDGGILINSNNVKTLSEIENILSHEIQHKIQELDEDIPVETTFFGVDENNNFYYKEANEEDSIRAYRNNKKEIDAEVSRVMNKMTKAQRHAIPLSFITSEVARYYSITPNKINIERFIPNLEKMYYNMNKGNDYNDALLGNNESAKRNNTNIRENGNEVSINNSINKHDKRTERYSRFKDFFIEQSESYDTRNKSSSRNDYRQELDNSSFSLKQKQYNNDWHDWLDKNFKSEGTKTYFKDITKTLKGDDILKSSESLTRSQVRKNVIQENRDLAHTYLTDSANWKDKSLISHKINTMKRNLRDIMPQAQADLIYKEYFQPISKNNATIEKEITKYNSKIESLDLSKKESTAVQMLGEKKYNPDTKLTDIEVRDYINKNNLDYNKLSNAVETFRKTYDELFTNMNNVLRDNGLQEIEYRKGYFPHFTEVHGKTILGKMAEKLGWKFTDTKLPTDIAGMTEFFTPNKKWAAFTQHRTGDFTDYNALKGFDNYVRGAMNIIYHTEDIQKLRALENEIRYQHSEKGLQNEIDKINNNESLSLEEKQDLIDNKYKDYNNELANFVTNLRDYTNNLASKKSAMDRSMENTLGRKTYNVMNNVSSRVSANMVGGNISSALTNFIPLTQAWSQISTPNMFKAMAQTISSSINDDGFIDKSAYLTNRVNQADKLFKTRLENFSEKATAIFEGIDSFTSQTIVRGKYLENLKNGMNEQQALNNADEFAKDVMAGRSLGDQPTIFNSKSPITKLFTAFQLEVNNQYGYMFKDMPSDLRDKGLGTLALAFFKMFIGACLYNKLSEEVTGRKSAFSPIDIIEEAYGTVTNDNLNAYDKLENITENISQELPFIGGLLGGGRLPISAALPNISTTAQSFTNILDSDTSDEKKKTAKANLKTEISKPLYYLVPPFGGGQAKKTIEGLSMYNSSLPIAGSYTNSGNLRFDADKSVTGKTKAALFGQYASKEAKEYVNSGYKTINASRIEEMKDLGMSASDYRNYRSGLNDSGTTNEQKIEYVNNLDNVTIKQKNIMSRNILNRTDFNITEYNKYGSYEEYNYAYHNPEKYSLITSFGLKYSDYKKYQEKIKTYSGNDKKQAIWSYINNLDISKAQKIMLFKNAGGYSINNYKNYMFNYINNLNISKSEKEEIWKQLYGD